MATNISYQIVKGKPSAGRPLANYARFGAVLSLFVAAPIWLADEVIHSLNPLGSLDTSIALWVAIFSLPLGILLIASGEPVLRSRHKHVGDFALLEEQLGPVMSTLAAVSIVVEHIATFALLSSVGAFFIVSAYPALAEQRLPLSFLVALLAVVITSAQRRRFPKIATIIVIATLVTLLVLIIGFIGASPYFMTTGSQDLAEVSLEITSRASTAPAILVSIFTALVTVMTPVFMMRHLSMDLSIYTPERARSATTAMVSIVFALGVVTIGVFSNVADIDSGAFLVRDHVVFNALRIIAIPSGILYFFGGLLLVSTFIAARAVLDDVDTLANELTNFSILPLHVSRFLYLTMSDTLLVVLGALLLLFISGGMLELIVPIVVSTGLVSLSLTRLAALKFWTQQLRYEGHSRERKTMRKAKFVALGGVIVSLIVLVSFLIADMKEGTWIAVALIALFYLVFFMLRSHYLYGGSGAAEEKVADPVAPGRVHYMIVALDLGPVTQRAVHWIEATRPHSLEMIHVDRGGDDTAQQVKRWQNLGIEVPLTLIEATSIRVHQSIVEHIRRVRQSNPNRLINVVIPHLVFGLRLQNRFYNAELRQLRRALHREPGVMITLVPWSDNASFKETHA